MVNSLKEKRTWHVTSVSLQFWRLQKYKDQKHVLDPTKLAAIFTMYNIPPTVYSVKYLSRSDKIIPVVTPEASSAFDLACITNHYLTPSFL